MLDEKIIGYTDNGVYVITASPDDTDKNGILPKDVPSFDGGVYDGIYSGGDNSFIVCINGAAESDIADYIHKLENAGYRQKSRNKMSDNLFYTYENGINLISVYLIKCLETVKVIAEPYYDFVSFIPEKNLVKPAVVASSICDRNFYIRLPNNSLVIVDGGWRIEDRSRYDNSKLLNAMYEEMREILGGEEIIKVPLWIITHAHTDHVGAAEYLYNLPIAEKFKISSFIYNFPAQNHNDNGSDGKPEELRKLADDLDSWHRDAGVKFPYEKIFYNCPFSVCDPYRYDDVCREAFGKYGAVSIKAHSGMKLDLCGVAFEVLHTPDDDMPTIFKNKNDTSVIIKMTYRGSSMLWLGDMGTVPSDSCVKMYGDYLKSDAMQVSHHGWGAATPEFYSFVKPTVLFWNNSEFGFKYADKYQGYGKTKTSTDLYNMDSVKKNIFCNRIKMTYAYLPVTAPSEKRFSDTQILASAVSDRTYMMRLKDGKVIVFGGGWRDEVWNESDRAVLVKKLYEEMKSLSGKETVTVAAWIASDFREDGNRFLEFFGNTEVKNSLNIEKIIMSSPQNTDYCNALLRCFENTGAELFTAQSGMKLDISGVNAEILYAPDLEKSENLSDTSYVIRLTAESQKLIYTGNMTDKVSLELIKKYGKDLKCDAVQVANQGYSDCGVTEFYRLCGADIQLWNNSEYAFRFFRKNEGYGKTESSTEIFGLKSCKLNVFCDEVKPQIFSFPINADELKYNV